MANTRVSDVYHLTASGSVSWFAEAILDIAGKRGLLRAGRRPHLRAIPTEAYPQPAARPRNSRLAADRLKERFGVALPDWPKSLALCMQEMIGNDA
jgi:dTDP-4-dehydrorhamnose reductase